MQPEAQFHSHDGGRIRSLRCQPLTGELLESGFASGRIDVPLSQALTGARVLLFDFDWPLCDVFAGLPASQVASELVRLLSAEDEAAGAKAMGTTDPIEVLTIAHEADAALGQRIEQALTAAEVTTPSGYRENLTTLLVGSTIRPMDAGVAAVLGAVVGALGTGGAGITAALLSKSQVRMQIEAEHARAIREPRKAAYAAFAEAAKKDYERLGRALPMLVRASRDESQRADALAAVGEIIDESLHDVAAVLEEREAHVYMEGPGRVIDSTLDVNDGLIAFRTAVLDALEKMENGEEADFDGLEQTRTVAHRHYLSYLHSASRALSTHGFLD